MSSKLCDTGQLKLEGGGDRTGDRMNNHTTGISKQAQLFSMEELKKAALQGTGWSWNLANDHMLGRVFSQQEN